jgi:hypothetical protein
MKHKLLFIVLFISSGLYAQFIDNLDIAVQSESIAYPFSRFSPVNPGIQIGTSLRKRVKAKSERNYNIHLGFYHHKDIENGIYLRGEYAHTFIVAKKLGVMLPVGLGYLHTFYPGELFSQNSDGSFSKVTQTGRAHVIATAGIGLSYRGFKEFEPYILHDVMVQYKFSEASPLLPHSFIRLGVKFKL